MGKPKKHMLLFPQQAPADTEGASQSSEAQAGELVMLKNHIAILEAEAQAGVRLRLTPAGLMVDIPTGVTTDAHPRGSYELKLPPDAQDAMVVLQRLLANQSRVNSAVARLVGNEAAPTSTQVEAWIKAGRLQRLAPEGQLKKLERERAKREAAGTTLEDLGL